MRFITGLAKSSGTNEKRFSVLHILVKCDFECMINIVIDQAFILYEGID
jgi:hypothetical protein